MTALCSYCWDTQQIRIALYSKLAILSTNYNSADEIENTLSAAQSLMIVRAVAGVLHETWVGVIAKHFLHAPEGRLYLDAMDEGGKKALGTLKKLFGKSGLLANIRNDFAFHYPKTKDMEAACRAAASDPEQDFRLALPSTLPNPAGTLSTFF